MRRSTLALAILVLVLTFGMFGPAAADPRVCVTYDFAGSELCVSDHGVEGADRFVPGETRWVCVIYTFSGGQICVSNDGQIDQDRSH